jgi:hypothetical protein
LVVVLLVELVSAAANWYAIAHRLPYALGGHGSAKDVSQQWVANGTALGPPLAPMVALALAAVVVAGRRWWGAAGDVLALVVAFAMLMGTLGEPSTRLVFEPGHLDAAQIGFRLAMVVSTGLLGVFALGDLVMRVRRRRSARAVASVAE